MDITRETEMNIDKPEPPKKRSKRHRSRKDDDKVIRLRCYISRLPVEILAEILRYIRPQDLLAMARTSKYFCTMLVSSRASTYIWKEARARFKPQPIPDPTPNFTESSYAAFLFDDGICEVRRVLLFTCALLMTFSPQPDLQSQDEGATRLLFAAITLMQGTMIISYERPRNSRLRSNANVE